MQFNGTPAMAQNAQNVLLIAQAQLQLQALQLYQQQQAQLGQIAQTLLAANVPPAVGMQALLQAQQTPIQQLPMQYPMQTEQLQQPQGLTQVQPCSRVPSPPPSASDLSISLRESSEGSGSSQSTPRSGNNNLIVNSLASWMDTDWLEKTFARFGEMTHAHVVCNITTGKSKGFGFVKFATGESAAKAVEALNGSLPPRAVKPIKVSLAREQAAPEEKKSVNVYIAGFKDVLSASDVSRLCARFGKVEEVKVLSLRNHSDGVCFVKYSTIEEATACSTTLNKSNQVGRDGRTAFVTARFADKLGKSRQNISENDCPRLLHQ